DCGRRSRVFLANPAGPSQTKPEATLASRVVVGVEWCPPVVGVEVRTVQSNKLINQRGRRRRDPVFWLWGRKNKTVELAKRALGSESQVALSLKELASVSPMMVEELTL
ncbi:hypothetical protein VP01_13895g1, partial [Puccinia sorghi]